MNYEDDNLDRLAKVLYNRLSTTRDWVGGPQAKILQDAAAEIERLTERIAELERIQAEAIRCIPNMMKFIIDKCSGSSERQTEDSDET